MDIIQLNKHQIGYSSIKEEDSESILNMCLLDEPKHDFSYGLVGEISTQLKLHCLNSIQKNLSNKISTYLQKIKIQNSFKLTNCWYNVMKEGEFNPVHDHFGDFSFVLIFKQNSFLDEEQSKNEHAGRLCFYSLSEGGSFTVLKSLGGGCHFYIFKSNLPHAVYPFKTKTLRYSLAGNIEICD